MESQHNQKNIRQTFLENELEKIYNQMNVFNTQFNLDLTNSKNEIYREIEQQIQVRRV